MLLTSEFTGQVIEEKVQDGINFSTKIISVMFNGKNLEEVEQKSLKNKILIFIKRNNNAFISDISDYFKISPEKTIGIVEELEMSGKIRRLN